MAGIEAPRKGSALTTKQREIQSLRTQRDQLLVECKVQPMLVSRVLDDMLKFMDDHRSEDKLAHGFSNSKENPWTDSPKSAGCSMM